MTVNAFTGGAGCGKTYHLMKSLSAHLEAAPLKEGQMVLALTFMHGSRRRLEERLVELPVLKKRADCATIDSFALRLVRRWRSLVVALGFMNVEACQYERVCEAAGALLQVEEVCGWVASTFPVLLVDEAQDLTPNRLRLIQSLASRLHVFAAADEFQCLKEELRPNPACSWLAEVCLAKDLNQPKRTKIVELIEAATAIRCGSAPKSGKLFKVELTPKPQLAGAYLCGNLRWYCGGKSVAIITPTVGSFAKAALNWAANNKTRKGAGPYAVSWEESEAQAASTFLGGVALQEENDIPLVASLLAQTGDRRTARQVAEWMDIQRRARSKMTFSKSEIEGAVEQCFIQRRRISKNNSSGGWRAMTVHGAKNREFDNVVVLWPAAITGDEEQKRRLLYNAVTRARERCLVLVQAKASLGQAPFTQLKR